MGVIGLDNMAMAAYNLTTIQQPAADTICGKTRHDSFTRTACN